MEMRKLLSVLTSFMFLFVPVVSKAMIEVGNPVCTICNEEVPKNENDRVRTECGCESCKGHLIKQWRSEEKKANAKGLEFCPFCPTCGKANSVDFYNSILEPCPICLQPMSGKVKTTVTKCGHVFDTICLKKWLQYKNTCPCCRKINPCGQGPTQLRTEEKTGDYSKTIAVETAKVLLGALLISVGIVGPLAYLDYCRIK